MASPAAASTVTRRSGSLCAAAPSPRCASCSLLQPQIQPWQTAPARSPMPQTHAVYLRCRLLQQQLAQVAVTAAAAEATGPSTMTSRPCRLFNSQRWLPLPATSRPRRGFCGLREHWLRQQQTELPRISLWRARQAPLAAAAATADTLHGCLLVLLGSYRRCPASSQRARWRFCAPLPRTAMPAPCRHNRRGLRHYPHRRRHRCCQRQLAC